MKLNFRRLVPKDESKKNFVMGAASSGFKNAKLDQISILTVKLTFYLFEKLDRQMIAALEKFLDVRSEQRRNVTRLIGELSGKRSNLSEIIKPLMKSPHNDQYLVFRKVCEVASKCQRYDVGTMHRLIAIGKAMKLSENEIYQSIEKTGLAD